MAGSLGLRAAPIIRFQWNPRLRYVEEVDKLLNELDIKPDDTPSPTDTGTPSPSSNVVELDELDDVEADEGNENDPEPVSYTHLDVYKRQPKYYPFDTVIQALRNAIMLGIVADDRLLIVTKGQELASMPLRALT